MDSLKLGFNGDTKFKYGRQKNLSNIWNFDDERIGYKIEI